MDVTANKDGAIDRTQVWIAAWIAVATSSTCVKSEVATSWADGCLKDFDARFPSSLIPETKGTSR